MNMRTRRQRGQAVGLQAEGLQRFPACYWKLEERPEIH